MTSYPLTPDLPVMNSTVNEITRPIYLKELKKVQAHRLWIAPDRELLFAGTLNACESGCAAPAACEPSTSSGSGTFDEPSTSGGSDAPYDRKAALHSLKENIEYFRQNGMEVGIWIQAFGFGDPIVKHKISWTRLKSVTGRVMQNSDAFCPEDPDFCEVYLACVKEMAALQPDLLMLDDDLCMSIRPGIGCFCDRHMKLLEVELGEKLILEELPQLMFTGGPNRYRDAWYQVMGDTLRNFCKKVRAAADEAAPDLRVGFCSGYTSWDFEGADAIELTKILAGKTKPFLRFTGAPYWCSRLINRFPGQKLNAVIECARLQNVWCRDSGVEVFAEADSYPRPCYHVNASYIENFDIAMRAEGVRSLKYMFDYFSTPEYEKQYLKIHQRSMPFYRQIGDAFAEKKTVGVRLFAPMHRIQKAQLPAEFAGEGEIMRLFFLQSAALLTGVGIPVCYEGTASCGAAYNCSSAYEEISCGAAFGEDALAIDDLSGYSKMILDLPAAILLMQKGVDTGLAEWKKAPVPSRECFINRQMPKNCIPARGQGTASSLPEERILLSGVGQGAPLAKSGGFFETRLKEGACPESYFESASGKTVSSYRYHNGTTEFLVLAFDALAAGESSSIFVSYCRQKQLMDFVGGVYPYIKGYSEIYSLCAVSEDGAKQAVVFENLSMDPVFDFDIELGRACREFQLSGAKGELSEDKKKIHIFTDFTPSSAILLEVTYI